MISIYCFKNINDEIIYVGSTKDIFNRYREHKTNCYNENKHHYNIALYKYFRDNNGIENFKFIKITECNEKERYVKEQYYIDLFKPKCNGRNAIFDRKEYLKEYNEKNKDEIKKKKKKYRENNKQKIKEWYENNKNKKNQYNKEYYVKKKEDILKYHKEWYENNKDEYLKKQKEWYEKNKEKIKEKGKDDRICCRFCKNELRRSDFKKHSKTKKHIENIKKLSK